MTTDFKLVMDQTRKSKPGDLGVIIDTERNEAKIPSDLSQLLQECHVRTALGLYSVLQLMKGISAIPGWSADDVRQATEAFAEQLKPHYLSSCFEEPRQHSFGAKIPPDWHPPPRYNI